MVEWFRFPRQAIQVLSQLVTVIAAIVDRLADNAEVKERLDKLERSRALWEAELEGREIKVEDRWKAVRASEERTRLMARRVEEASDDENEVEFAPGAAFAPAGGATGAPHAPAGGAQGVPALHSRLAPRGTVADRKWGRG